MAAHDLMRQAKQRDKGKAMKRKTFVTTAQMGMETRQATAYAWNSCLKAGESLVREWARELGTTFERGEWSREGDDYTAVWYGGGGRKIVVRQGVPGVETDDAGPCCRGQLSHEPDCFAR